MKVTKGQTAYSIVKRACTQHVTKKVFEEINKYRDIIDGEQVDVRVFESRKSSDEAAPVKAVWGSWGILSRGNL